MKSETLTRTTVPDSNESVLPTQPLAALPFLKGPCPATGKGKRFSADGASWSLSDVGTMFIRKVGVPLDF